jgi:hypothetical protein
MAEPILDSIIKLIYSPPGQLATGVGLGAAVWKGFGVIEHHLNDDAKLKIAIWLLYVHVPLEKMQTWPETFASVFDRVFGQHHVSWKCFWRVEHKPLQSIGLVSGALVALMFWALLIARSLLKMMA